MKCTIQNKRNGTFYSYGISEANEEIKVLDGHLFYNKIVEVEEYKGGFYLIKKLNYDEEEILTRYLDDDHLVSLSLLKEDLYVSKPYKRIYELDGYWFFVPKILTEIVEYLYDNDLVKNSKIKLTKTHTISVSRAPIISVNYDRLFQLVTNEKRAINSHFYCERNKDFANSVYADFYVLGNIKNSKLQFELWEIIADGTELFYSHFIQDINSNLFTHFDLATHVKDHDSTIEDLLTSKIKPKLTEKIKWFRNDDNFTVKQIFDITKLFFPLENLVDEFLTKSYG